ncbi:hypothetical protein [Rhodopila sp.]|uniref:hypothetical protein n=1 Tax=Rhodopila sp. TaxID=2480087 RepID=UPI003D14A226
MIAPPHSAQKSIAFPKNRQPLRPAHVTNRKAETVIASAEQPSVILGGAARNSSGEAERCFVWQVETTIVSWDPIGTTRKGQSMGARKILLVALVGILLGTVAGQSALADDVPQFATFLKDPVMRQNVINAAAKSTVIVQNPCSAAQYSVATMPIVLKPMVFDSAGHPTAGMLKFPVKEEGCGITRILNTLIWVQGPGTEGTAALAPGTTHADPVLQKDASMRAYTAAVVAARPDPACDVKYLADTEFIEREKAGSSTPNPWRESWTIVLCNKKVVVPVKFIPDLKGTTIVAGGPETKVSRINNAPQ